MQFIEVTQTGKAQNKRVFLKNVLNKGREVSFTVSAGESTVARMTPALQLQREIPAGSSDSPPLAHRQRFPTSSTAIVPQKVREMSTDKKKNFLLLRSAVLTHY